MPTSKPQPDGTLIKALARAWRWQRMLEEGVYASLREIAEAEGIDNGYVSRILRLALVAPKIVEVVLDGRQPTGLHLRTLLRPLPVEWARQAVRFSVGP